MVEFLHTPSNLCPARAVFAFLSLLEVSKKFLRRVMFQITLSPVRLTGGIHGRSSTKIKVTYDDRLLGRVFLGGTVRFQINTKKDEIDFHVFLEVHSGRILGKAMIAVRDIINKENSHIWCVIRSNDQISVKHRLKVLISSHRSFGKKIARKPTFSKHQIQDAKEFGQTVLRNEAFVNPLKTVKSDNEKKARVRRRLVDSRFRSALVAVRCDCLFNPPSNIFVSFQTHQCSNTGV